MIIKPTEKNFRDWIRCIPRHGDLLFFTGKDAAKFSDLPVPLLTSEEVRAQSVDTWTLNQRSWYGYSLNRASHCAWLPSGLLKSFDEGLIRRIGNAQLRAGVPTLLVTAKLPSILKKHLLQIGRYSWLSSQCWSQMPRELQMLALKAWFFENDIEYYQSLAFADLPSEAQAELKRLGLRPLLNTYASFSGPNCFATVAGALAQHQALSVTQQWLHWEPLARLLKSAGYHRVSSLRPQKQDVLVFRSSQETLHASYYLGEGIYFEKPGQDFYEPYRVVRFERWKQDWPQARLALWRRHEG